MKIPAMERRTAQERKDMEQEAIRIRTMPARRMRRLPRLSFPSMTPMAIIPIRNRDRLFRTSTRMVIRMNTRTSTRMSIPGNVTARIRTGGENAGGTGCKATF